MTAPMLIHTETALHGLVRRLYSPKRKVPIIVISTKRDRTGPVIRAPYLQEVVGNYAKVYLIAGGVHRTFNELLDNIFGIEPTGVRIYLPRLKPDDCPVRHRVWNETMIKEGWGTEEAFVGHLYGIVEQRHNYVQKFTCAPETPRSKAEALFRPRAEQAVSPEKPKKTRNRKLLCLPPPRPPEVSKDSLIELQIHFSSLV